MPSPTQQIGNHAEQRAKNYLQNLGFKFVENNYHSKYGEIDLIMQDQDSLVFVEVRYRDNESHGGGIATITRSKKSKLIKTATCYLLEKNLWEKIPARFDVIAMSPFENEEIVWIKDAFGVNYS